MVHEMKGLLDEVKVFLILGYNHIFREVIMAAYILARVGASCSDVISWISDFPHSLREVDSHDF